MNIVIVGDGTVGHALSEQLNLEGHDITVIDNNQKTLDATLEMLDVLCIHGNGATQDVQEEAGVSDADLLIAATSADEINMVCCLMANFLGAKHTIARIRNPEYLKQLDVLKERFGLSMAINPELEAAREISRVIKLPPALKVDTFARGGVELVEFKLPDSSPIANKRLRDLSFRPGAKVLICAVDRDGDVTIPNGNFVLEPDDKIYITGESHAISQFIYSIGDFPHEIRSIIIVGGGRVGYYLGKMLAEKRFQLKIIEKDGKRCEELCELLPKAIIIHGDGSDINLLESEGIDNVDAFITLTGMDEENIVMSMVAANKKVSKVVTKVDRFNYLGMLEKMDLDVVISPKMTTANKITQYVRAMGTTAVDKVETLYKLVDGKAEALEFIARESTPHLGVKLEDLPLHKNLLIAVIVRNRHIIIPGGKEHIQRGDSVIVVTSGERRMDDLSDIFNEG